LGPREENIESNQQKRTRRKNATRKVRALHAMKIRDKTGVVKSLKYVEGLKKNATPDKLRSHSYIAVKETQRTDRETAARGEQDARRSRAAPSTQTTKTARSEKHVWGLLSLQPKKENPKVYGNQKLKRTKKWVGEDV